MSIHIGKNAIYNPDKVFRIETDNSNVLNLQSTTNKVNLNIQDFTLGQTYNIDKILNISTENTDLVSFKNDNITFYPEVFITSNVNITSNITILNNINITGKINTITDVINISDDGNINTNSLFASNINIFTDINKDVLVLGSNNENGFNTLFLISSSNNGEIYIKGNLGVGTEPSSNNSIIVSSNVLVNANTYTSNIYTNKISNRDITSISGISFTEDTLYLTADNSVIINKYSLGTELNLETLNVNERLDTNDLNVSSFININNDTNYPALLIKQGLTEEGLFVNSNTANPISVLSEFTNDRGNLSNIFQLSAKGHITLGGLYPDPENTNSEYMIRGDVRDDKLDYINGFINFTNCNIDKESFTITQDGHIGIGTQIPKGFLEIKNNYTEINDNYTKPDSILKLENNGTNIPFMKVISSNNSIFEISNNATFNFIQEYDNGYNIVASNIYAPNINIDTIKSSSNIINLYNATLSNISHMDIGFISSSNVFIDGKLTITGTVNAANLSTNVVSVYKDGDYSELYFDNDKMLTNATGIAINVGTDHYSYSNSRITGVYLNTNRDVSDIRALHILGENSTIRNTVNNQNNRFTILDGDIFLQRNAKTYQEFNVNSNIFQIGIKNLSSTADTNASIYITSFNDEVTEDTIDVNNNNCALSISKNNEINIANNFFIDEVGKISVGYNGTSLEDNFNVKGDVRIVNDSNETLFIIENNGNIGFGTEQGQSRLHINTTTSNQDYFVVYDTNTNNTEFIIDKNNRIGIGTVNNTDAKLIIKGDIIPGENGVYTLGNENNTWSNVYISNFIDINGSTLQNNEIGGIEIKEPTKQQLINYQYYNSNTSEYYQYYTNSNEMMNTYDNMIPKNSLNINNSDIYYNSTTDRVVNNLSLVSPPVNNEWLTITWAPELGLFVAVAYSGTGDRVMTSPNGINWTTRSTPVDNDWIGLTWSSELGLLVATSTSGTGNRVMTSPDGINWTTRSNPVDNNWYGITWAPELGLFVAVASSGTGNLVMTSSDGINWTTRSSAADNNWYGITWAPELGLFITSSWSGSGNRVMTSPDGINWTTHSTNDNNWQGITWAPELGLLVAVSGSGKGNRVMTAEGTKINKSLLTAKNDIVSIQGSLGIRTEPAINSGLTIRQSVSPNIINSSGHNLNVSPGIQLEGDVQKWGIFITGKDDNNDLVFTQAYKNLNYEGVCAYISRYESNSVLNPEQNFTGQHRCHIENIHIDTLKQYEGLIVSANNNKYMNMVNGVVTGNKAITVNESLPIVNITSKNKDKSVFGVISSVEDTNNRNIRYGSFVTPYNKIKGDNRVFINSIGEGSIWISNKNGNIYSGEYITSSDIPGYGQKQEDDILHNYTVAKITMDCDFNPVLQPIQKVKISNSSNNINEPETDEYGNIIFEDTDEYEYSYEVRYLQKDGSIITQEDYNTLLSYGSNVYKAAFVGCTYHCG